MRQLEPPAHLRVYEFLKERQVLQLQSGALFFVLFLLLSCAGEGASDGASTRCPCLSGGVVGQQTAAFGEEFTAARAAAACPRVRPDGTIAFLKLYCSRKESHVSSFSAYVLAPALTFPCFYILWPCKYFRGS